MPKREFRLITPGIKDGFIKVIEKPVDFLLNGTSAPIFHHPRLVLSGVRAFLCGRVFGLGRCFILIGGISDTFDGKSPEPETLPPSSVLFWIPAWIAMRNFDVPRYHDLSMRIDTPLHYWTSIIAFCADGIVMVSYVRARARIGHGRQGRDDATGRTHCADRYCVAGA